MEKCHIEHIAHNGLAFGGPNPIFKPVKQEVFFLKGRCQYLLRIRCQFKIFKFYCLIKKFPLVKLFKKIVIFKCSVLVKNRKVFNGLSLQSTNRYFRRLQNREYLNKAVVKRALFRELYISVVFPWNELEEA